MLIKPWNDQPTPRHTIELENESAEEPLVPDVSVDVPNASHIPSEIDYFVVTPQSIKVITSSFPKTSEVAFIKVAYNRTENEKSSIKEELKEEDDDEEYDEDEQLYKAATTKPSIYKDEIIPILKFSSGSKTTLFISAPHFGNAITNNIIARKLVSQFGSSTKAWITLSPSNLNNGQTINKLDVLSSKDAATASHSYKMVPYLKPPHFITGISASINSVLNLKEGANLYSLILNSDGQPGFEILDTDAIVDSTFVLVGFLVPEEEVKEEILGNVSKAVRKFTKFSSGGMYL